MRPIAIDGVAWSVCLSVGLSVTTVSPTNTTEAIVMPFVTYSRRPRDRTVYWMGVQTPYFHSWRGNFEGEQGPAQDMSGHVRWSIYSKWLSRGQHRYGEDTDWGVLDEVHTVAYTTEPSTFGGDAALCQIALTTCWNIP